MCQESGVTKFQVPIVKTKNINTSNLPPNNITKSTINTSNNAILPQIQYKAEA
jgi:hypothetical protein